MWIQPVQEAFLASALPHEPIVLDTESSCESSTSSDASKEWKELVFLEKKKEETKGDRKEKGASKYF